MSEDEERLVLGSAIKQAREELGLTQELLAKRLGVSVRTVSRWEQGVSQPRGPRQKKEVATALALSNAGLAVASGLGLVAGPVLLGLARVAAAGAAGVFYAPEQAKSRQEEIEELKVVMINAARRLAELESSES